MRLLIVGLILLLPLSASAQDMPECTESETALIVEGKAAFERFCRACHAPDQIAS
jgi:cytochrome c5